MKTMMEYKGTSSNLFAAAREKETNLFALLIIAVILAVSIVIVKSTFKKKAQINDESLQLVALIHRHGLRTILESEVYQNDPYKDEKVYWPLGYGQLTLDGKKQLYNLGKNLRNIYGRFTPQYTAQSVKVYSSDLDRCIMSAASMLAGFFPPDEDQAFTQHIPWQPIPIHTVPLNIDKKLAMFESCPRYDKELKQVAADTYGNMTEDDKQFFKYLQDNMNNHTIFYREAYLLNSLLQIEAIHNLTLPGWTERIYPEPLDQIAAIGVSKLTDNTVMKKLKGGPLLDEILDNFVKKSKGDLPDMKLFIYSAHDLTIIAVWRAVGIPGYILPYYGATMLFELHLINEKYFVKISYLNNTDQIAPETFATRECGLYCPLDNLLKNTEQLRPVNWTEECQL